MSPLLGESPSTAMSTAGKLNNDNSNNNNENENSSSSSSTAAAVLDRAVVVGGGRRRKIEIKRIEDQSSLFVAFSKRRNGLFKKLKKFVSLNEKGTQAAVVTFSPAANKVHADGTPAVEPVLRRFLDEIVAGGSEAKLPRQATNIGSKRKRTEGRDQMLVLDESEAAWLEFRREVEMRMTEETVREVRTVNYFI